jgi:acyl-phosphate glycerol 3-phosphate acyltransferase
VDDGVEFYSSLRSRRAIEGADICVLMVDATLGVENQDLKIATLAWESGRGLILVVNKWDLKEKENNTAAKFQKDLIEKVPYFAWVPTVFTSALTGQRVTRVLDLLLEVNAERHKRITTSQVNETLEALVNRTQPPQTPGHNEIRLNYATQVETGAAGDRGLQQPPRRRARALHPLPAQRLPGRVRVHRQPAQDRAAGEELARDRRPAGARRAALGEGRLGRCPPPCSRWRSAGSPRPTCSAASRRRTWPGARAASTSARTAPGTSGATNALRVLGWRVGLPVFLFDALKGFVPAFAFWRWFGADPHWALAYGLAAIVGHVKPVFLLGRGGGGGKGVATAAGVFLGLAPLATAIALAVFAAVVAVSGYVSLGSLAAAVALVAALALTAGVRGLVFPLAVLVAGFVFWSHRANIGRLRRGEEATIRRRGAPRRSGA